MVGEVISLFYGPLIRAWRRCYSKDIFTKDQRLSPWLFPGLINITYNFTHVRNNIIFFRNQEEDKWCIFNSNFPLLFLLLFFLTKGLTLGQIWCPKSLREKKIRLFYVAVYWEVFITMINFMLSWITCSEWSHHCIFGWWGNIIILWAFHCLSACHDDIKVGEHCTHAYIRSKTKPTLNSILCTLYHANARMSSIKGRLKNHCWHYPVYSLM